MKTGDSIFVAGHRGLVGSALVRRLRKAGFADLLLRERRELDLTDASAVAEFFARERPRYVFLAAARVGGILGNSTHPADFIRENLAIELNVIDGAYRSGTQKLLFLGSSCIYPRDAPQPMSEACLLTGPLEPTNEAYAVAKIAGLTMCRAYRKQYGFSAISVMPTNLYGPEDNFSAQNSHVLPALLRRFHDAKQTGAAEVVIWGSGRPRREFLYVDDLADACLFLMQNYDEDGLLNVGWGHDLSISGLAVRVARVVGFEGALRYDTTKPDGAPRKLLDTRRLSALGWTPSTPMDEGLRLTYEWFLKNQDGLRT